MPYLRGASDTLPAFPGTQTAVCALLSVEHVGSRISGCFQKPWKHGSFSLVNASTDAASLCSFIAPFSILPRAEASRRSAK